MNKAELIDAVAAKTGETKVVCSRTLEAVLSTIESELASGNDVALAGFGSFKVAKRAAREGRNPASGETIQIPAAVVAKFSPATALKKAVDK